MSETKLTRFRTILIGFGIVVLCVILLVFDFGSESTPNSVGSDIKVASQTDQQTTSPLISAGSNNQSERESFVAPKSSDPFSDEPFHIGPLTIRDVRSAYFNNIEQARAGNVESMVSVGRALLNCQHALSFADDNAAWDAFNDGMLSADTLDHTLDRIDVCGQIADDTTRDFDGINRASIPLKLSRYWFDEAATSGNDLAKLHSLDDLPGQEIVLGQVLDTLLSADQVDPYVYFRTGEFISVRSTETNRHEFEKWGYVGCIADPSCDQNLFRDYVVTTYVPAQALQILEFPELLNSGEALVPEFAILAEELPYTVYTPNEIEQMRKFVEDKIEQKAKAAEP